MGGGGVGGGESFIPFLSLVGRSLCLQPQPSDDLQKTNINE